MKKFLTWIIAAVIIFLGTASEAAEIQRGECGRGVYWSFDSDGTLTIYGSGEMDNYLIEEQSSAQRGWFYITPWNEFKQRVTRIVISDGVRSIGSHAFADLDNLKAARISNSVNFIGSQAFSGCRNLESVNLPPNVRTGNDVFLNCNRLSSMSVSSPSGKNLAASNNLNANEYSRWAKPVKSYLYVAGDYLIRVENIGRKVIVEQYTSDFRHVASKEFEGSADDIFGGFFAGRDANYVIVGRNNDAESDRAEVIRVMKFSKDWDLIKEAKIYGANTKVPFDAASLRCAESDGSLYIRTGHQMFRSPDGLNHQSNMSIVVDEARMEVTHMDYLVRHDFIGYVSHSLNQFILIDAAKNIVMLDQGDAYPRAIVLNRYRNRLDTVELVKIPGATGDNATGASLGGLAETGSNYVTVCSYDNAGGDPNDFWGVVKKRNLYAAFTSKRNFSVSGTKFVEVPRPDANAGAGTPFIVPVNQNLGYIIWNETRFDGQYFRPTGRVCGARYDDGGNVNFVGVGEGQLSDCQPIIYQNRIVWYVTNNSAPVFYTFDGNRLEAHKAR